MKSSALQSRKQHTASFAVICSVAVATAALGSGWSRAQAAEAATAPGAVAEAPQEVVKNSVSPFAERFPNLVLKTHEGKNVRFYEDLLKGKIVLINFMYATCKERCPGITQNLVKVQKLLGDRMGKDVWFYSLTLEPENDSPEVLAECAKRFGVGPGWLFLTGRPEDLETLRQNLGFAWSDPVLDADLTNHIGTVKMGNEPRSWWGAVPSLSDPRQIARLLVWMAPEPGQRGTIGNLPEEGRSSP